MFSRSIILNADSYKYSQWNQYPPGTEIVYSYIESRGGEWDSTVFFGVQAFLREYLSTPITQADIDVAEKIITAHGEPFYREGWQHILDKHAGRLPVVIKAAPEGSIIPTRNVLLTIENTDPACWWLTTFLETALLRAVWYPTTVATNSYESKKIILQYLEKTGDPGLIDFKLHDFGARGVSSLESAALGGMAHLVNFQGTDTVSALLAAREYYDADMAGVSIPASEHSISGAFGK
jgi:nicotinamide phosphoribosyltransferase